MGEKDNDDIQFAGTFKDTYGIVQKEYESKKARREVDEYNRKNGITPPGTLRKFPVSSAHKLKKLS